VGECSAFADLCARRAIQDFQDHANLGGRVFFDRGFLDVISAVERLGLEVPQGLESAVESKRYAQTVFMSPPWEALFRPDAERRHGFADAVAEFEALVPSYRRHGYEIVFLPECSTHERVEFVLSGIRSEG
jgi:predicted ATPase